MAQQFKYGVCPVFPEAVLKGSEPPVEWHTDSGLAAGDVLFCFDLGATEVNIKIVKNEEVNV